MYYYKNSGAGLEHIYLSGSLIAKRETVGNVVKFQHTDALGSPVAVTDGLGNVIERNDYAPYGAVIGKPAYDAVGYTGHNQDGATGLTYMQQRYYDPQIGRLLSVDSIQVSMNNRAGFNRYVYASYNPYRFIDPDGRSDLNVFKPGDPLYAAGGLLTFRACLI
ncbi:RHS repeat-associated core domain-containing protein [Stenotrophomonas terrae]|uniref:RHS repeat-associated core domain-containing protein n=1 Tax=Stenotrophomonas terrae TaxID=405446 RepID=UPI00320885AC